MLGSGQDALEVIREVADVRRCSSFVGSDLIEINLNIQFLNQLQI